MDKVLEAYFKKKDGVTIWVMYSIFFFLGYWYGVSDDGILFPIVMFILGISMILIFGKKEDNSSKVPKVPKVPKVSKRKRLISKKAIKQYFGK